MNENASQLIEVDYSFSDRERTSGQQGMPPMLRMRVMACLRVFSK